jgi:hypothetical protein
MAPSTDFENFFLAVKAKAMMQMIRDATERALKSVISDPNSPNLIRWTSPAARKYLVVDFEIQPIWRDW